MKKVIYLWLNVMMVLVMVAICCLATLNRSNELVIYESIDQLALVARERLNSNQKIDSLLADMNINTDYSPFIIIYDDKTAITYTNISNDFTEYTLPLTISITDSEIPTHAYWRPDTNNVYAISSLKYSNGYLVVGRNNNINELSLNNKKASIIYLTGALSLLSLIIIVALRKIFRNSI